ncbi:cell wall hydrolase [Clostridium bowmanii]|nr:cell wall hydrolase [Clostridium bowmanii]
MIAKSQGVSLDNLRKANNNLSDTILPGQVLKVGVTNTSTAQTEKSSIKYTASDLDMLSRLITAEAQGEPYDAQVAVGEVVINRVKHNLFPNSISSVINQKTNGNFEFTPVLNGNIKKPATESAVKAAYEALHGNDPTNNALFFFDGGVPKGLTSPQPVSIVIGHMTFVYLIES